MNGVCGGGGRVPHSLDLQHEMRWDGGQFHARPPLPPQVPSGTKDTLELHLIHLKAPGMGTLKKNLQHSGRNLNPDRPIHIVRPATAWILNLF